jgi:hypothetical protein
MSIIRTKETLTEWPNADLPWVCFFPLAEQVSLRAAVALNGAGIAPIFAADSNGMKACHDRPSA